MDDQTRREGSLLRQRRKELKLSQERVAEFASISLQSYQKYEYGERLFSRANMQTGLRICYVLELDPFEAVFENMEEIEDQRTVLRKQADQKMDKQRKN